MDVLISLFLFVAKISLTAGIIAAIVLIARLLIGKKLPRRVCYAMWGLVLLRLVLPVSLPSPTSIFNHTSYTPQYTVFEDFPETAQPSLSFPSAEFAPDEQELPEEASAPPAQVDEFAQDTSVPENSAQETSKTESVPASVSAPSVSAAEDGSIWEEPLPAAAACIWLFGMLLFLLSGLGGYLFLLQKYKTACLHPNQQLFDRCNSLLKHPLRHRVPLYISRQAESPLVIGVFRPRIILPEGNFPEEQLRCMVTHELVHIRRGDHLVRLLSLGLACIHWFNPLVWLALRFSAKDMELSCDEAALSRLGSGAPAAYAGALLDLSVRQHRLLSPLLMFGESNLKTRIKNALSYKKPALWVSVAAVLLLIAGAVVLLTDPIREPEIFRAGDTIQVNLSGIPLTVTADKETAALLNPDNWQQTDALPTMKETSSLRVETETGSITFSQTEPAAILYKNETETAYTVPLGTEETLRARLLETSEEFSALPENQQQILSALVNAETIWGMRDYADYFAVTPDFVSRFVSTLMATPGETTSGIERESVEVRGEIYLYLVNPRGETSISFWAEDDRAILTMGETQVILDPEPFEALLEEFADIPFAGWSTDFFQTAAPGFTELPDLPKYYSSWLVDDWLVCWGDAEKNTWELQIFRIPDGELLYTESTANMSIDVVRAAENSLYDIELSGTQGETAFVWGIKLGTNPVSNLYLDWPHIYPDSKSYRCSDIHLTDTGVIGVWYNGYELAALEDQPEGDGEQHMTILNMENIREAFLNEGLFAGEIAGLQNVQITNDGQTVVADISADGYPFTNGTVLAVRNGSQWNTRILTGSKLYPEGNALNSFYKILADGTIACYQLDENGWVVELIDPNTLETIRTLDFGGYSPDYLSLERRFPLSISGDAFYSPRVILRLIDRNTALVTDRSYKLEGERIYLFNFTESTLSEPVSLNSSLYSLNENWIVTSSDRISPDGTLQAYNLYSRPLSDLTATLQSRELRPVLPKEEIEAANADPVLLDLFNIRWNLVTHDSSYYALSDSIYSEAFHPLHWTLCEEQPVLPDHPDVTATDLTEAGTDYASANFFDMEEETILELLPLDGSEPRYYTASRGYPYYVASVLQRLLDNTTPNSYYYTGRDADRQQFESKNRLDILDAAALLQTGHRLRYDNRTAHVLTLNGDTAICLVIRSDAASYADVKAEPGLMPENARPVQIGGTTFYETDNSLLLVYQTGEADSALTLSDAYAKGLVSDNMLAEAQAAAAEEMPRLYRDETTFRIEQLLNFMNWRNEETGNPAAMFDNQFYYRFAELMAAFKASDDWESWQQTLQSFLDSKEEYAEFRQNLPLALQIFYPGEIFRQAIQDAWGSDAETDWDNPPNLLTYYPDEDIVATAYGIGFESSSHRYPVSFAEENGRLTVSYVTLLWYPGDENPYILNENDETVWIGEGWPLYPTLAELTQRAGELPLRTAEFVKEDGRWIFADSAP